MVQEARSLFCQQIEQGKLVESCAKRRITVANGNQNVRYRMKSEDTGYIHSENSGVAGDSNLQVKAQYYH